MSDERAAGSRAMLDRLFRHNLIALRRGPIYDSMPAPIDVDDLRTHGRVEGMLLGVAAGDALGHSTEWKFDPEQRHRDFGTILDHVSPPYSTPGRVSDDTQLTFWALERLLARAGFDFEDLVDCYVSRRDRIVGLGMNVSASLRRHEQRRRNGTPALHACAGDPATKGRGNGALMRFAPFVLPHLHRPSPELWSDATLAAILTHGNPVALSAAVAFTHLLWEVLRRPVCEAPEPEWWLDQYVRVARELEPHPLPVPLNADHPIPERFKDFRGTLWQFIDGPVREYWKRGVSVWHACSLKGFGSRADSVQTVPAVLYILMHHADSFESSIIAAVNDTKDNDTTAAIVGALVGALHGRSRIRRRWLDGIQSSSVSLDPERQGDDRTVLVQLAQQAAARFL